MEYKHKINPKLTKEKIISHAIKISDENGIQSLSMRKLAESLGVEAMSLYHHFKSKKELIHEMTDSVVPKLDPPCPNVDWKDAMRKRAHAVRDVFINHPWAAQQFVSEINTGPAMFAYSDSSVGYLIEAGFSYPMADYAWNLIDSYIYGFNLQAQNFPFKENEYQEVAKQYVHMIPKETYPYVHSMTHEIIKGTHDGIQDFDFGLELILESLDDLLNKVNKEK